MILIYTVKITPRVKYIFNQFFGRIMGVEEFELTSKLEDFIAHNGPKLNYSKNPLSNEFFIRSHELLFEQGIDDIEIQVGKWDDVPCFFSTSLKSSIPFDIFAASFYLLSRYEEYLPQMRDDLGRYVASESIAYKNGFLDTPVVDIWAEKFIEIFKARFPELQLTKPKTKVEVNISVDHTYKFLKKGVIRTVGGLFRDLFKFRFSEVVDRFMTIAYMRKDPFDLFDSLVAFQRAYDIPIRFFYLVGPYNNYDQNISFTKQTYQERVKANSDYADLGILSSYASSNEPLRLSIEKTEIEEATHWSVKKAKQYHSILRIPEVYQNYNENGIEKDYSLGYENSIGFRASTCHSFYFYDLDFEIQTPLMLNPFYFNDRYFLERRISPEMAKQSILELFQITQTYGGYFSLNFHSDTFALRSGSQTWKRAFEDLLKTLG